MALLAKNRSNDLLFEKWGGRWGLNPRPPESQSGALPTELRPPLFLSAAQLYHLHGAPGRTRTCNPQLRRLMLYPIELRAHRLVIKLVGVERFELPTHCSQSSCATRLRYTPKPVNLSMLRTQRNSVNPFPSFWAIKNPINSKGHPGLDGLEICRVKIGAPGEIRTPDRPVRSRVLYPAELRARCF